MAAASRADRPSRWRALVREMAFIPDPQLYWVPYAYRAARRALRGDPISAVLASGPPFSTFLLGRLLAARFRVPLVLDYRDVWGGHPWWPIPRWRRPLESSIEARLLRRAGLVVVNHEPMRQSLLAQYAWVENRCLVIPNGFDRDEMGDPIRPRWQAGERFEIVYAGTLYGPIPRADGADVELSVQRPREFLRAIGALARRGVFGPAGVRVTFIGASHGGPDGANLVACARAMGVADLVEVLPRADKPVVVPLLRRAHVLLNILYHTEAQVAQKVYDYLHLEIPVLSLIRGSELNVRLVAAAGPVVDPMDAPGIERALEAIVRAYEEGRSPIRIDRGFVDQFDVSSQARTLNDRIEDLVREDSGQYRGR
jgi:glycosyltransferase involved in cell wall biosynthesis